MIILMIFFKKIKNKKIGKKYNFIFYKIVATAGSEYDFTLQCLQKNVIFNVPITEIVNNTDILYALHPAQACYIGIKYVKYLNNNKSPQDAHSKNKKITSFSSTSCRY